MQVLCSAVKTRDEGVEVRWEGKAPAALAVLLVGQSLLEHERQHAVTLVHLSPHLHMQPLVDRRGWSAPHLLHAHSGDAVTGWVACVGDGVLPSYGLPARHYCVHCGGHGKSRWQLRALRRCPRRAAHALDGNGGQCWHRVGQGLPQSLAWRPRLHHCHQAWQGIPSRLTGIQHQRIKVPPHAGQPPLLRHQRAPPRQQRSQGSPVCHRWRTGRRLGTKELREQPCITRRILLRCDLVEPLHLSAGDEDIEPISSRALSGAIQRLVEPCVATGRRPQDRPRQVQPLCLGPARQLASERSPGCLCNHCIGELCYALRRPPTGNEPDRRNLEQVLDLLPRFWIGDEAVCLCNHFVDQLAAGRRLSGFEKGKHRAGLVEQRDVQNWTCPRQVQVRSQGTPQEVEQQPFGASSSIGTVGRQPPKRVRKQQLGTKEVPRRCIDGQADVREALVISLWVHGLRSIAGQQHEGLISNRITAAIAGRCEAALCRERNIAQAEEHRVTLLGSGFRVAARAGIKSALSPIRRQRFRHWQSCSLLCPACARQGDGREWHVLGSVTENRINAHTTNVAHVQTLIVKVPKGVGEAIAPCLELFKPDPEHCAAGQACGGAGRHIRHRLDQLLDAHQALLEPHQLHGRWATAAKLQGNLA
mmetsp:Transcript_3943/g.11521  ORF Transcript_3943/g.11521 Transcript_3943/m.11521 type:complete len:645 (+) Transcript_3943:470-2404(+)